MSNNFEEINVKCPFFNSIKKERLICEGITDDCISILKFNNKKNLIRYCNKNCYSNYEGCDIYKAVDKKYDEKK